MVKLQENKGSFFVTIPISYVRLKGWETGTSLFWTVGPSGTLILNSLDEPQFEVQPKPKKRKKKMAKQEQEDLLAEVLAFD